MSATNPASDPPIRQRLHLRGQVQGVGFRPFVYRLAQRWPLTGHVANDNHGATIELQGTTADIAAFTTALHAELPPLARITACETEQLSTLPDESAFRIVASDTAGNTRPEVTPDAATCPACIHEIHDPKDRRHGYAFTNCTNCGPRYTIICDVPYDRPFTTMAAFTMCPACQAEYDDPANRRFHAQPNACPSCGPQLELIASDTNVTLPANAPTDPLAAAATLLTTGHILAIKGLGGYHLACRADAEPTVQRLRDRKLRDGKPLALMVPNLDHARALCHLTPADCDTLQSPAAPIVLIPRRADARVAPAVAPGAADLGVMLPYTPLHHLLLAAVDNPLVLTSANLAGQPLTFRDEAASELATVADAFLRHNREIVRPVDDSVVFTFRDEPIPIRRARGYAPQPLHLAGFDPDQPLAAVRDRRILATGGELKATACLLTRGQAVLSEHLGDLSNAAAYRHYTDAIARLQQLCGFTPDLVACDAHPRYLASQYARGLDLPLIEVQHHHAHVASVMAEWGHYGPLIGISCDGTGYGEEGAIWGGEILRCENATCDRVAHLAYFPLVGGDTAALETWRPAAALVRSVRPTDWGDLLQLDAEQARVFDQQITKGLNAPPTSSLGRVFDAVAWLLGLCDFNRHEAEAAMAVEAAARQHANAVEPWPLPRELDAQLPLTAVISPLVDAGATGPHNALSTAQREYLAARFHETVSCLLTNAAAHACERENVDTVALTGGCFANRLLLDRVASLLEQRHLKVLYHRRVPAGDGGLALGQALVAAWQSAGA
jgi:hydrogenase maturation protein HypF